MIFIFMSNGILGGPPTDLQGTRLEWVSGTEKLFPFDFLSSFRMIQVV